MPGLCRYTSAAFCDGKLGSVDGLGRQEIQGWGSGLRRVEVPHQGNTNASRKGARWRGWPGAADRPEVARQAWGRTVVEPADILIVTPYGAQIRAIERRWPRAA
jgi:hypothetical protein